LRGLAFFERFVWPCVALGGLVLLRSPIALTTGGGVGAFRAGGGAGILDVAGGFFGAKNLIINTPALGRSVNFRFFARSSTFVKAGKRGEVNQGDVKGLSLTLEAWRSSHSIADSWCGARLSASSSKVIAG
jgi:hypothetical protein